MNVLADVESILDSVGIMTLVEIRTCHVTVVPYRYKIFSICAVLPPLCTTGKSEPSV